MKIAFIGLGTMGFPMARHLSQKGYDTAVWNRNREKARAWVARYDGRLIASFSELADRDIVLMCLGNDASLRAVAFGEQGILAHMQPGAVLVDHTTASATIARELYKAAKDQGKGFIDAPVSGGQAGAENGILSVMCGGDREDFARVEPVLQAYGKTITHLGVAGNGQLCKMVNQICVAGVAQGLSEGVAFALKAGLDAEKVFKTLANGAAGSWQMNNRHQWMIHGDFQDNKGFAVEWMLKDLGLCFDEAERIHAALPIARKIYGYYTTLNQQGMGRWDTAALVELLKKYY